MNPWLPEHVESMKRMLTEGLTFSQIGARLGKSRNAVIGKAHREGLSRTADYKKCHSSSSGRRKPKAQQTPWRALRIKRSAAVFKSEPFVPAPEIVVPLNERKGVLELSENDCRWPIGDPQHADFHFCNGKKVHGLPYCEAHCRVAFVPPERRRLAAHVPAHGLSDRDRGLREFDDGSAPINTGEKELV